jgi:hypothetical protein
VVSKAKANQSGAPLGASLFKYVWRNAYKIVEKPDGYAIFVQLSYLRGLCYKTFFQR